MDGKKRRLNLGDIIRRMSEGAEPEGASAPRGADDRGGRANPARKMVEPPPPPPEQLPEQPSYGEAPRREEAPPPPIQPPAAQAHAYPAPVSARADQAMAHGQMEYQSGDTEDEEEFDIFRYIGVIMRHRGVIAVVMVAMTVFSLFSFLAAPRYYGTRARLLFKPEDELILPSRTFRYWKDMEKAFNTHLELLKSRIVLERVAENLGGDITAAEISAGLTISQGETDGEKNDIIELTFKHPDAQTARDVINDLCRTYIEYHREVNAQENTRLILNLKTQIDKLEGDVEERESALRRFKEQNRLIQLSEEANLVVTKLANMELALQQTQLDMLGSKEQLASLKSQINQQAINVVQSMTYENPFQNRLADLELELNTLSAEYSGDHFKVRTIKQQIESLKEAMETEITKEAVSQTLVKNPIRENLLEKLVTHAIDLSSLEAKRTAQEQIIERLNAELLKLPSLEQEYAYLQREASSRLQTLALLKQKYEESKIERDAKESDIKILELAKLPVTALSSKKLSSVFMGILVGLILGIALAFLLEYLDQTLKDVSQVEKGLELPLLGIVPHIEAEKTLDDESEKLAKAVFEPFRALRANLKHLTSMHRAKVLMLCSAVKGEGKTTLSVNLALTFAMDGKKVILVDGDLRRSQIHHFVHVPKEGGLFDYLNGTMELAEIIKATSHENLYVITSGERPPNPAELLGRPRFEQMLTEIREHADIVIYDSPALLPVSDSIIMAPKMDGCLMVVRTLWTPMRAAKQAKGQLLRIGTKIMGCILNGVPHSRGYYPYYYGYYGYYAYRYSYDEEPRKKLSVRALGLRVESKVRESIKNQRMALPRYIAAAGRFTWHILRRPLFWLLFVVLVAITALRLHVQQSRPGPGEEEEYISFAGDESGALTSQGPAIQVAPPDEPFEMALPRSQTQQTQAGEGPGSTIATEQDGQPGPLVFQDSIALWVEAVTLKKRERYASFYDTDGFRYPGGGAKEWIEENTRKWLSDSTKQGIIKTDTVWAEKERGPYHRTMVTLSIAYADTAVSVQHTMIWKWGGGGWRIIREKVQEAENQ